VSAVCVVFFFCITRCHVCKDDLNHHMILERARTFFISLFFSIRQKKKSSRQQKKSL
jgi:hypothetical protein